MPRKKRKMENDGATLKYSYAELSIPRNEIRLLNLQPGKFDDDIQCNLRHISLDECPEYTALSYTWGDPVNSKSILIDNFNFNVTLNLYSALQHLREQNEHRIFWIDALCINQNDLSERSRQVLRMRDIYSKANRVEVWLGKADEDDYRAMELVRKLGEALPNPEELLSQEWERSYNELFVVLFEQSTPEVLKALNSLYRRPWWARVWVVQEVSLANQPNARVTCGRKTLRWLHFLIAAYAIEECWLVINTIIWQEFPDEPLDGFQHGIRLSQCRRVGDIYPPFALLELLHQHRDCAATDPRDYVYGLLGMSGDGKASGVEPDYTATPQKIYIDLTVKHLKYTGSLDIICACRNPRNFRDLPSWVPDWSTDQLVPGICINQRYCGGDNFPDSPSRNVERYHSAGTSGAKIEFWEDGLHISASGFSFGRIIALGTIDDGMKFEAVETFGEADENGKSGSDSETFNNWLNLILDSPNWSEIEKRYGEPDRVLDAFCRSMVANRNNRMMRPSESSDASSDASSEESSPTQVEIHRDDDTKTTKPATTSAQVDNDETDIASNGSDSVQGLDNVMFSPADILNMTQDAFRSCIEICWGKRLAILDSGFIGLVPGESNMGDPVYIFMGCSLPLVIRQVNSSYHQIIGESYFHGVTEGELMDDVGVRSLETIILE